MIDTVKDIDSLRTALTFIKEGASDEKRQGMTILENMLSNKEAELKLFEDSIEEAMSGVDLIPELKTTRTDFGNKFTDVVFKKDGTDG
jgi:hypothetical protein